MDKNKIKEYWTDRLSEGIEVASGDYQKLDQYRIELILYILKVMMKTNGIKGLGNLLDFGCGHARFIPYINSIIPGDFVKYVGVDLIDEVVKQNNEIYKEDKHINFCVIKNDVVLDSRFNNYFNSIFSITVLQHVLDEKILMSYIRQFWDLLKNKEFVFIVENISAPVLLSQENRKLISETLIKKLKEKDPKIKEEDEEEDDDIEKEDLAFIVYRSFDSYKCLFKQVGFVFVDANIVSLMPNKELHFFAIFRKEEKEITTTGVK